MGKFKVIGRKKLMNCFQSLPFSQRKIDLSFFIQWLQDMRACQEVGPGLDVQAQSHCYENVLFMSRPYLNMENEAVDTKNGCD